MRLVEILSLSSHLTWNDILGGGSVARIAMNKDAATFGGADRETTNAVFFMQELQFSLLLAPLGASLFFATIVWLGEELFNGDD